VLCMTKESRDTKPLMNGQKFPKTKRQNQRKKKLKRKYQSSNQDLTTYVDSVVPPDDPCLYKFRRLVNWLVERGARFPECQLRSLSSTCRGTFTRSEINTNEEIMYIPQEFIITSEISAESEICQKIKKAKVEVRSKHTYLASYLLQERDKGQSSWWFPYLDILPKDFESVPLFFKDTELNELQNSIALQKIKDRHDSLQTEFQNLCKHVPEYNRWTYKDFVWARLVVITRIFGLLIDGVKTDGLVPMADMINHRRPRETRWTFNQMKRGFIITALQDFTEGQQIFDSYGRKCNSRFFVNYGFSLEENPDNEAVIRVSMNSTKHGNFVIDFQLPMNVADKKSRDMLSVLRWSFMNQKNEDEFEDALRKNFDIENISKGRGQNKAGEYLSPVNMQNELAVLKTLKNATEKKLKKFPHTLQQDTQLLSDTTLCPPFSNHRNIVLMRRGEKEVLHHWYNLACIGIHVVQDMMTNDVADGTRLNNYLPIFEGNNFQHFTFQDFGCPGHPAFLQKTHCNKVYVKQYVEDIVETFSSNL